MNLLSRKHKLIVSKVVVNPFLASFFKGSFLNFILEKESEVSPTSFAYLNFCGGVPTDR